MTLECSDPSEGYHGTNMLPQVGENDAIHHGKVGVNKAAEVVQNDHVQRQGIMQLRLRRSLLRNSLGYHA